MKCPRCGRTVHILTNLPSSAWGYKGAMRERCQFDIAIIRVKTLENKFTPRK